MRIVEDLPQRAGRFFRGQLLASGFHLVGGYSSSRQKEYRSFTFQMQPFVVEQLVKVKLSRIAMISFCQNVSL